MVVVLTACLLVAGASTAGAALPTCSLVSSALISSKLGESLTSSALQTTSPRAVQCLYFGEGMSTAPLVTVDYVRETRGVSTRSEHASPAHHAVPGIADGAYFFRPASAPRPGEVSLVVLKGTTSLEIDASVSLSRIEGLAKQMAPLLHS